MENMTEDLSKHHRPIGMLLARTPRAEDLDRYRLSEEQIEFFRENGYLKGIRILSVEQVEALRGELEKLMNLGHAGRDLFHEYHSMNRRIRIACFFTRWARGAC